MKVVVVEDELNALETLVKKLELLFPEFDIAGTARSLEEGQKLLQKTECDLLFLDIELRDGSGFDLLESLGEISFEIVFTTAYNEYALDAFKVNAVDYLLKPINNEDLQKSVERVNKRIRNKNPELYDKLTKLINERGTIQKLALKERGKITFIDKKEILYLKAEGVYTEIVTKRNKYMSSSNLGAHENNLNSEYLKRIHRSYIVNLNEVTEYFTSEHSVKLSDGSIIPVSGDAFQKSMK